MKIDTTRTTLASQFAGNIPAGAEVLGLVMEPVDRLHSALVRIPATGIYVTMCGDAVRSVDQREARQAVASSTEPDATLYDSDTTESVTAEDLGITAAEYAALIRESLQCTEDEGHVKTDAGRRVYAD